MSELNDRLCKYFKSDENGDLTVGRIVKRLLPRTLEMFLYAGFVVGLCISIGGVIKYLKISSFIDHIIQTIKSTINCIWQVYDLIIPGATVLIIIIVALILFKLVMKIRVAKCPIVKEEEETKGDVK